MSKETMKLALEKFAKAKELCDKHGEKINRKHVYGGALIEHFDVVCQALAEKPAQQGQVAWVPYLSDRADGVTGHYAIARWNPRGYREVWNLRRHAWGAYSDDVLSLEEADTLLRLIEIPTRKVEAPQPAQRKPLTDEEIWREYRFLWPFHPAEERKLASDILMFARAIEAAHGIKENT